MNKLLFFRLLIILMVTLSVSCSNLPVVPALNSQLTKNLDQEMERLSKKYWIKISYKFELPWNLSLLNVSYTSISDNDINELNDLLYSLDKQLNKYPKSVLKKLKLDGIYIYKNLSIKGQNVGGFVFPAHTINLTIKSLLNTHNCCSKLVNFPYS